MLKFTTCAWLQTLPEEGTCSSAWYIAPLLPPLMLRSDAEVPPFLGDPANPNSRAFPSCCRAAVLSVGVKPLIARED